MARGGVSIQRLVPVGEGSEPPTTGAFSRRAPRVERAATPVRARGVGGILDTAVDVFVARLGFCLAVSACLWLLAGAAERLVVAPLQETPLGFLWDLFGALTVEHVATALVVLVVYGEMRGYRIPAGQALRVFLKRLPALTLYILASVVLMVGALFLGGLSAAACLVFVLPVFLFVAVRLAFGLAVAPAALVLERLSPIDAVRRSFYLVRGSFWRWVGLKVVYSLLVLPFAALPATLEDDATRSSLEAWLGIDGPAAAGLWLVATALFAGVGTALSSVVMTVFYLDCRVRVEGLDLALRFERIERRADLRKESA